MSAAVTTRWWLALIGMSLAIFALDLVTGPYILFPLTFVLPVSLATWKLGRSVGIGTALILGLGRFCLTVSLSTEQLLPLWAHATNAAVRLVVLVALAVMLDKILQQKHALERKVKILEGILPICGFCNKIRDEQGNWQRVDRYIASRSEASFSHGFCDPCGREHYPDFYARKNENLVQNGQGS